MLVRLDRRTTQVADLPSDIEPILERLRLEITRLGLAGWRTRYGASAAEVLDLLAFTRVGNRSLLRALLETGRSRSIFQLEETFSQDGAGR
jgi:hypothetical protein